MDASSKSSSSCSRVAGILVSVGVFCGDIFNTVFVYRYSFVGTVDVSYFHGLRLLVPLLFPAFAVTVSPVVTSPALFLFNLLCAFH